MVVLCFYKSVYCSSSLLSV